MKKAFILTFSLLIFYHAVSAQISAPYHNLEKYWWYRYRLINDFMYIDQFDSVGGSLPAQSRDMKPDDFVFKKDNKLMPLNKVADYVKANNHLPDVPSADEVKKEGIDLGSMDAKLLQKIEELTLYVIQQDKRIDELQKKLDEKK
jgi:hypothetical protein